MAPFDPDIHIDQHHNITNDCIRRKNVFFSFLNFILHFICLCYNYRYIKIGIGTTKQCAENETKTKEKKCLNENTSR